MDTRSNYCRSCFRDQPDGVLLCPKCAESGSPSAGQKMSIVLGLTAVPFVLTGMMALNARTSLIGVAIAIVAVLIYAGLSLRS